jgi:hypothetical protein
MIAPRREQPPPYVSRIELARELSISENSVEEMKPGRPSDSDQTVIGRAAMVVESRGDSACLVRPGTDCAHAE